MFISQVHTHIQSLFNTQDKTDAMADGVTSCSSVRYTHTYTLFIFLYFTYAKADAQPSEISDSCFVARHSATFRRTTNQREKALTAKKCLKGGSKYSEIFYF